MTQEPWPAPPLSGAKGMGERAVAGAPKFGKNGIHLSAALLKNYGFNPGDSFKFPAPEAGKIVLKKV